MGENDAASGIISRESRTRAATPISDADRLALVEAGVRAGFEWALMRPTTGDPVADRENIAARVLAERDAKHAEANND